MTILRYLTIFVVFELVLGGFNRSICRNDDGKHYLLFDLHSGRTAREIPDEFTLKDLNESSSWTSRCNLKEYVIGSAVPSLQLANDSPDEWMRVTVHKAKTLNPVNITEEHAEYGYFNPCMAEWKGRTLLTYPKDHITIQIVWLEKGSKFKISNETLYGFGPAYGWIGPETYSRVEDPRLFALSNGSLLLMYSDLEPFKYHYFYVMFTYNEVTQKLEHSTGYLGLNQKNWVVFEAPPLDDSSASNVSHSKEKEIFFIPSLNPWQINGWYNDALTGQLSHHEVKTNYAKLFFPFANNGYRGSSNALHINGDNLIFFHTRTLLQPGCDRMTYFMGALTFCPNYPFNVHSMSEYPILEPGWYDGPWMNNRHDYIVYPTGAVLSEDKKRLIVSSGYQDIYMRIISFDVVELLHSLVKIQDC